MTGFLDLLTLMTLSDLEPPRKGLLVNFFLQFLDAAHILTLNCNKMAGERPRQLQYGIFGIKLRFWQFKY